MAGIKVKFSAAFLKYGLQLWFRYGLGMVSFKDPEKRHPTPYSHLAHTHTHTHTTPF